MILPVFMWAESLDKREAPLIPIATSVEVDATPQQVWDELVAFSEIGPVQDWIFEIGISYPIKAEIKGHGKGAVRHCIFTTGAFVEPIEVWDEPRLMQFSVLDQPPPLVEWSPYGELHLPHLENYFVSEKGQFRLQTLENGKTLLEGTTWYRHDIWPISYWSLWSDFILHRIHYRVLNHIKEKAER